MPTALQEAIETLRNADNELVPASLVRDQLSELMDEPATARELVARVAACDPDAPDADMAPQNLLEWLLDEARRADENGKPEGRPFLDAAGAACAALTQDAIGESAVILLGGIYQRAGLSVPDRLKELGPAYAEPEATSQTSDPDQASTELARSVHAMIEEAQGDLFGVYSTMQQSMAAMPDDACAALVHEVARWPDASMQRLCLYWLLDPRGAVADAASQGLAAQAEAGTLAVDTAGCLAWLRNLLAEGSLRGGVDAALSAYRKRSRSWPRLPQEDVFDHAVASVPDGVGAQYLALCSQAGDRRHWSMVLIKAGHGVRDAYVLRDLDDDNEREIWQTLTEAMDFMPVAGDVVNALLGAALAENLDEARVPPPGLLDVALASGLSDLRPHSRAGPDWLAAIDPAGELDQLPPQRRGRLINASAEWPDYLAGLASWFEDTSESRAIVMAAATERQAEQRLRAYIHERRASWAELCLRSAIALRDTHPPWLAASFAVTGCALLEGRELRRIPIIDEVIATTIAATLESANTPSTAAPALEPGHTDDLFAHEGEPDPSDRDNESVREVLQLFYDRGRGARVWPAGYFGVCGYVFAVATHPEAISPADWVAPLLHDAESGASALHDESEGERVVGALANLYADFQDRMTFGDPLVPPGCEASVDPRDNLPPDTPIRQWARGFAIAVGQFGHLADRATSAGPGEDDTEDDMMAASMMLAFLDAPERVLKHLNKQNPKRKLEFDQLLQEACESFEYNVDALAVAAMAYWYNDDEQADDSVGRAPIASPSQPARSEKVGRNEPCPCGSGRKYKRCCGDPRA